MPRIPEDDPRLLSEIDADLVITALAIDLIDMWTQLNEVDPNEFYALYMQIVNRLSGVLDMLQAFDEQFAPLLKGKTMKMPDGMKAMKISNPLKDEEKRKSSPFADDFPF
jgi:hypothetical protein